MGDVSEKETVHAPAPRRLPVQVGGFDGTLEELVLAAQRGDVDLRELAVAQVTTQVGRHLSGPELGGDLRDAAEALSLLARLLSMKAARITGADAQDELEEEPLVESQAGQRLAEYRLYRAAMEALLVEPAEMGGRSFLGLVAPDILPLERLRIPPERLTAAFRQVLERLQEEHTSKEVRDGLARLPDRARMALVLRYFADMSYDEIADTLGVRRAFVGVLLLRARHQLRDVLGDSGANTARVFAGRKP